MERSGTFTFYRLSTIGWANPLIKSTGQLLCGDLPEECTLDLSQVEFVDSFGVTYMAACFQSCMASQSRCFVLPPRNQEVNNYLIDVGLYESAGLGQYFRPRSPSSARVDLVHVTQLQPGFIDFLLDFLEHMQPFATGVRPSMRLTLVELLQNFVEYSGSIEGAWVAGQFHPRPKGSPNVPRVTLCFLDRGRGIPDALRTVRKYRRIGDARLIEKATMSVFLRVPDGEGRD
jgi:ABC-type transporter Mla MlaB component